MFKYLIGLVLVALAAVFSLASSCPAAARSQRGYADLQDGALYRIDLWIPATDGLPFCFQWSQSA